MRRTVRVDVSKVPPARLGEMLRELRAYQAQAPAWADVVDEPAEIDGRVFLRPASGWFSRVCAWLRARLSG